MTNVTADNILYDEILQQIKIKLTGSDFKNVYIGRFKHLNGESIRIYPLRSEVVQNSNRFEEREYFIIIRIYFHSSDPEFAYMGKRTDRLNKTLLDNVVNATNWYGLKTDINYDIQDDENIEHPDLMINEIELSVTNYNVFNG